MLQGASNRYITLDMLQGVSNRDITLAMLQGVSNRYITFDMLQGVSNRYITLDILQQLHNYRHDIDESHATIDLSMLFYQISPSFVYFAPPATLAPI